jgi:hypothetical protein
MKNYTVKGLTVMTPFLIAKKIEDLHLKIPVRRIMEYEHFSNWDHA